MLIDGAAPPAAAALAAHCAEPKHLEQHSAEANAASSASSSSSALNPSASSSSPSPSSVVAHSSDSAAKSDAAMDSAVVPVATGADAKAVPQLAEGAAVDSLAAAVNAVRIEEPSAAASSSPSAIPASAAVAPAPSPSPSPAAAVGSAPAASAAPASSSSEPLLNGGYKRGGAENDPLTGYYDEIEIEDMDYDAATESYLYPCPCGDKFRITKQELMEGEDIARCPSCSLLIKVIYDPDDLEEED